MLRGIANKQKWPGFLGIQLHDNAHHHSLWVIQNLLSPLNRMFSLSPISKNTLEDDVSKHIWKWSKWLVSGSNNWAHSGSKKESKSFLCYSKCIDKAGVLLKNKYIFLNEIIILFLIFICVLLFLKQGNLLLKQPL